MSNVIIIKSGFQKINVPDLRLSSNRKDENLFKSNHVKNVEEWKSESSGLIKASVIRQTSIKQHFDVTLDVDINRNVTDRRCNCPVGLGRNCKHIAAVVNINFQTAEFKTSQRFQCNIPLVSKHSEEYSKGRKVSDLIPKKAYPKQYEPIDLVDLNFLCSLGNMLKSVKMTESTKTVNWIIRELINTVIDTACIRKCLNLYNNIF